jgi:hypothetical protein
MSDREAREPVTVRGHTLLCLQGFRGEGYSPAFVDNMATIHAALADDPGTPVRVVAEPDRICGACPHRAPDGCTLNGDRSERGMIAQDRDVLARLGLEPGTVLPWRDVLARIRAAIDGHDLPSICGSCRWLPLGYCAQGLMDLRRRPI